MIEKSCSSGVELLMVCLRSVPGMTRWYWALGSSWRVDGRYMLLSIYGSTEVARHYRIDGVS